MNLFYTPTCPRGYTDCVNDPAYRQVYDPDVYFKFFGDKSPKEVSKYTCSRRDTEFEFVDECYDNGGNT